MGIPKKYTAEEKEKKRKEYWHLHQKPRMEKDELRVKPYKIDGGGKLTKKKAEEFKNEVREINRKRFEDIINNREIWEYLNTSSEIWQIKKERQERAKRSGKGKWVTKEEVERAEKVIWGGMNIQIFKEDDEERPYENPYGEMPENE